MMARLWRWLLHGDETIYLPKSWLANVARLRAYEGYTRRQHQQGSVVRDVAACRRAAFWAAIEAKRAPKALRFPRQAS